MIKMKGLRNFWGADAPSRNPDMGSDSHYRDPTHENADPLRTDPLAMVKNVTRPDLFTLIASGTHAFRLDIDSARIRQLLQLDKH
jgi:hypothetical protein